MQHFLKDVIGQVEPAEWYDIPTLAEMLGMARSSVMSLHAGGFLPGATRRATGAGTGRGKYRVGWTGQALVEAAGMTELPPLDHSKFKPATLWRLGCGCDACLAWHNESTRELRRRQALEAFPEEAQRYVLELVGRGKSVAEAAADADVSVGQVFGLARWHREFREALDEAGWALCKEGSKTPGCSTPTAYRRGCRGTGCRRAHHGSAG